jgi:hypothetical protein
MGTVYKVGLEDLADAFDSLDEDDGEELRALVDDSGWLDLDMSGREIGLFVEALIDHGNPYLLELDEQAVKKLAKAIAPVTWEQFIEYVEDVEDDDVRPYYEEFRALVLIAAKLGQGLSVEAS